MRRHNRVTGIDLPLRIIQIERNIRIKTIHICFPEGVNCTYILPVCVEVVSYKLADGKNIFYLGFEEIFDGPDGAMSPDYSGDGVHLYGKCYKLWRDWILENGKIY